MLDREEERRLAEIEARLRAEEPQLHELFANAAAGRPGSGRTESPDRPPDPRPPDPRPPDPVVVGDALDLDPGDLEASDLEAGDPDAGDPDVIDLQGHDPAAPLLPPAPPEPEVIQPPDPRYPIAPLDWVDRPRRNRWRRPDLEPTADPADARDPTDPATGAEPATGADSANGAGPTDGDDDRGDPSDERRHPSQAPRRRWDDGPDAEVRPPPGVLTAIVRTFVSLILAIAITAGVTVVLGPDVGGFVAVVVFCVAGMYGYQTIRGCPGLRRARGQD